MFFKRPKWKPEVEAACAVIGEAIGRAAAGEMPPDFIDFSIDGQIERLRSGYAEAEAEGQGEKARRVAQKTTETFALAFAEAAGGNSKAVNELLEAYQEALLGAH